MIWTNIKELNELLPIYQRRIIEIYHYIFEYLKIPEPKSINEIIKNINLESILAQIIQASRSISSQMGLILLFLIFILLENRFLNKKLYLILRNHPRNTEILDIIEKIKSDVKTYFLVKTIISVSTWLFCYLIMWCFWLNFAIFWGLLAFLLNYIPNIGSIIAVFLPVSMSLVQPEFTFWDSFLLAILLTITQIILWNIVEPQLMGNRLNISPLFLITSLALWGNIWWIPGMILSVPIMVIINIILAEIPAMRPIAILLSEKWDLQIELNKVIKNRKKLLKSFKSKFDVIDDLIKKK